MVCRSYDIGKMWKIYLFFSQRRELLNRENNVLEKHHSLMENYKKKKK